MVDSQEELFHLVGNDPLLSESMDLQACLLLRISASEAGFGWSRLGLVFLSKSSTHLPGASLGERDGQVLLNSSLARPTSLWVFLWLSIFARSCANCISILIRDFLVSLVGVCFCVSPASASR